jgi:hypothetical protein
MVSARAIAAAMVVLIPVVVVTVVSIQRRRGTSYSPAYTFVLFLFAICAFLAALATLVYSRTPLNNLLHSPHADVQYNDVHHASTPKIHMTPKERRAHLMVQGDKYLKLRHQKQFAPIPSAPSMPNVKRASHEEESYAAYRTRNEIIPSAPRLPVRVPQTMGRMPPAARASGM